MIGTPVASTFAYWVIPILWVLAALLFILFFFRRRRDRSGWALLVTAGVLVVVALAWMASAAHFQLDTKVQRGAFSDDSARTTSATKSLSPESQAVFDIVVNRCQACHSDHATMMSFAAFGLSLDTMKDVDGNALPIYREVVELQQMPMGNATHMTQEERATIARWYTSKQH